MLEACLHTTQSHHRCRSCYRRSHRSQPHDANWHRESAGQSRCMPMSQWSQLSSNESPRSPAVAAMFSHKQGSTVSVDTPPDEPRTCSLPRSVLDQVCSQEPWSRVPPRTKHRVTPQSSSSTHLSRGNCRRNVPLLIAICRRVAWLQLHHSH